MVIGQNELVRVAVAAGLTDWETVRQVEAACRKQRRPLVDSLMERARFPEDMLYRALAEARGLPYVDVACLEPDREMLGRMPHGLLERRRVLPIPSAPDGIAVATADPDDRATVVGLERLLGQRVQVVVTAPTSLKRAIARAFLNTSAPSGTEENKELADAVELMDEILKDAYLRRASDIHIEPGDQAFRVRLRIDGWLETCMTELSLLEGHALLTRVKVLSGMDIAEQKSPQDGAFTYRPPGGDGAIDVRVATIPSTRGERATLRLLGSQAGDLTLESLGMSAHHLERFRDVVRHPYGMVLLTGPTGSGKTTTLYAALREINRPQLNIMTVEDPVEYRLPGACQVEVSNTEKVTFASALRSLLRHDPDVLMLGEIRDSETADIAFRASLTGHLVLSTLHTGNAAGAVLRLLDLGVEPYLVGSTLLVSIAQRLVRRLCSRCRSSRNPTPEETELLRRFLSFAEDEPDLQLFDPVGCAGCSGSGYRGHTGLFECLWVDRELSRRLCDGAGQDEIEEAAEGSLTLLAHDGCEKALAGVTTLEEVKGEAPLGRVDASGPKPLHEHAFASPAPAPLPRDFGGREDRCAHGSARRARGLLRA